MEYIKISIPHIKGEDAEPILDFRNERYILGVCDGLGGKGSYKVEVNYTKETMAKVGSRELKEIIEIYFRFQSKGSINISDLERKIEERFRTLDYRIDTSLKIRDDDYYPTTLALALAERNYYDLIKLTCIWAGDSRIYALEKDGLYPLTKDDTSGDFFPVDSLPLTNWIAKNKVSLKYKEYTLNTTDVLAILVCSDGFYSCFPTPWELNSGFIQCLQDAYSIDDIQKNFERIIEGKQNDDISASILFLSDFKEIKRKLYFNQPISPSIKEPIDDLLNLTKSDAVELYNHFEKINRICNEEEWISVWMRNKDPKYVTLYKYRDIVKHIIYLGKNKSFFGFLSLDKAIKDLQSLGYDSNHIEELMKHYKGFYYWFNNIEDDYKKLKPELNKVLLKVYREKSKELKDSLISITPKIKNFLKINDNPSRSQEKQKEAEEVARSLKIWKEFEREYKKYVRGIN